MIEYDSAKWATPAQAAEVMSKRAGYRISTDDIRQLKRIGRIKKVYQLNRRITLYDLEEIRSTTPPKKRKPVAVEQDKEAA